MNWEYKEKSYDQLKSWFQQKVSLEHSEFIDLYDFLDWYKEKEKKCFYCGLSERESQNIVHNGLLKSKRFPIQGMFSQGVNRGYWLELDRKDPYGKYSRQNCELSCYFCNNDKSDVFNEEQYKEFLLDRPKYLRKLIDNEKRLSQG